MLLVHLDPIEQLENHVRNNVQDIHKHVLDVLDMVLRALDMVVVVVVEASNVVLSMLDMVDGLCHVDIVVVVVDVGNVEVLYPVLDTNLLEMPLKNFSLDILREYIGLILITCYFVNRHNVVRHQVLHEQEAKLNMSSSLLQTHSTCN